jgi:TolB protein
MKYAKILVTVFVVAAANSLATWFEPSDGTFSPDGTKVAYVSGATGDPHNIYTVNADGTGKVKFELEGGLWGEPYFSPDGKKIAFINGDLFLVDVDGKNLTQLARYGEDPDLKNGVLDDGLTLSPDGRKILYCSEEFGSKDIFSVNVDGTGKTRLTDFAGSEERPVFLAGGDEILFNVRGRGKKSGIWIMNADGSGKKRLSFPANAELVALSPDGKKITYAKRPGSEYGTDGLVTYVADLDGSSEFQVDYAEPEACSFSPDGKKILCYLPLAPHPIIGIINADGTGGKNLTPDLRWVSTSKPAFFAGGAKIVFSGSRRYGLYPMNIYTMDADGANLKAFKATEGMDVWDLFVSPTGDRFLFEGDYYGGFNDYDDYFVVNADGTGLARLTTWYSEYNPYGGKFSADGSKVAYLSNETGDYHIYTVDADGTGKVKFELEGGLWGEPYLSPDGKKVAFVNYYEFFQKGNIFVVDADGRNLTQVTPYGDDDDEITDDPDRGIGVLYEGLTFSPDGRKILYCSVEFGSKDIFAVNVDGTGKTRLTDFADCEESGPVFLAGGDKVLFTVKYGSVDVDEEIWVMNADGSGKKKVPVPGDAELKAVSPDGKKIMARAMYRCEDPYDITRGTFVADLDGSRPVKIAGEYEHWLDPSFSPDGKKVLFRTEMPDNIHIINADGTGEKRLTTEWVTHSFYRPAFFANGAKIVYGERMSSMSLTRPRRFDNIYTMDADGSNQKLFKATEGMYFSDLVVSPTGDRFLFQGDYEDHEDGGPGDYFVVNADGSGLTRLTKKGRFPDD